MFMNSHVSLKSFHTFSAFYPEINMLGEISKHFRFMETHALRNHVNFQNQFDFSQPVKAKYHFNTYWSYAILTKKATDSPYTSFVTRAMDF